MEILVSIFFLISGILIGILTGLIPGIHSNLVFTIFLTLNFISNFSETNLIIFIVSAAITHTFLNVIPSIYLGAPDIDSATGILPFHKYLLKGLGHSATKLTLIGSTIAIISLTIIVPIFLFFISKIYDTINQMMAFILIWTIILLIYFEKEKLKSILIIILAGFLGIASFNLQLEQPILPLLTGLFATSTLINSIKNNSKPPEQLIEKLPIEKSEIIKPTLATILVSPICSLLPGLGSSQAAIIGSSLFKNLNREQFLILLGSVNTLVMSTSFLTLYLFQKSRTGAAIAISQITTLNQSSFILILVVIVISSILSIPLTLFFSKLVAKNISKINYTKMSKFVLIFLVIINFTVSGFYGILVLLVATLLGLFVIEIGAKRNLLMSSILIPTIIFYLPF